MPEKPVFRVRVWFRKTGRLAYLSHLELARSLERAIRRAGLPYVVSQGFSPHMKIAFGSALPVGVGGLKECFDLQLARYIPDEEVVAALLRVSVPDLAPFACKQISNKTPAASVAYPVSDYEIVFSRELPDFELPEKLIVLRKKKEKVLLVDDYLYDRPEMEGDRLYLSLVAKPTGSLRVDTLVGNLPLGDLRTLSITRIDQHSF